MSASENEDLIRRYFNEAFVNGNTDIIDDLFAADYVNHGSIPGEPVHDRDGMKRVERVTRDALPDIAYHLERVVASGDTAAHHWTATATHTGVFMGVEPTGRRFSAAGMVFSRIADGRIAEQWRIVDVHGVLQQLTEPGDGDT